MRRAIMAACVCLAGGAGLASAGALSASAATSSTRATYGDKAYLRTSLEGDQFEVLGGKLALARSHNKAVLALARTLVKDHSKSFKDGADIARRLGVEIPKSPAPSMVWELKVVGSMSGRSFDRWYTTLEIYDHHQDIQETTDEVKFGSNQDIVKDAKAEVPILKKHLKMSEAAYRAAK